MNRLRLVILSVLSCTLTTLSVFSQTDMTFTLSTDCWGGETSWGVFTANEDTIVYFAPGTFASQQTFTETFSLDDGCYELRVGDTYGDGLNGSIWGSCSIDGDYSLVDEFGNVHAVLGVPDFDNLVTHEICLPYTPPSGCTDPVACNYDELAGVDDGTCEFTSCAGCLDATACNYNATATLDDASCEFTSCAGCTDSQADNYDPTATIEDGSCTYPALDAIINYTASGLCPGVTISFDGSSSLGNTQSFDWSVAGPENFTASGASADFTFGQVGTYDVTLTVSDGTLSSATTEQIEIVEGNALVITILPDAWPQEVSYTLTNADGVIIDELVQGDLPGGQTYTNTVCLSEGCHNFNMVDSYGDGLTQGGYYSLTLDGVEIINSSAYGTGESTPVNCPEGTSCFDPLTASLGTNTATYDNTWFSFIPETTGQYNVTTCGTTTCNTIIWVYDYCQGLPWDDTVEGSIYFSDDDENCSPQSNINPLLEAGQEYFIRIGDSADDCTGDVDFEVSFLGEITGCMDINACNFEPLATISNGVCYYNDDEECSDLGPDLYVLQDVLQSSTYLTTLTNIQPDDCYIQEGCIAGTGDRDIVRFTTHIKNIGNQDYYIGQESDNTDQFEFDPCHGHYHYEGYAEYVLYDNTGVEYPEIGFKNGFCVLDLECSDGGTAKYGCSNMGISAGCGDIYSSGLACQWVDVTTLAAGTWTLVVRTNWDQSPDNNGRYELRYDNNWAQVCFSFERDADNNIINFVVEPEASCTVPVDCLGQPFGTTQPDCNGDCPGLVVKGDANSNLEIEAADAQEYVTDILGNDAVVTPCSDIDEDNAITVTDAALLARCSIYGEEHIDEFGVHNHCEWNMEITNQDHLTTLSVGDINVAQAYVDIMILNPDNRVVGYEFEVSGIEILSVENLYTTDYSITPVSTLGGTKVIGLSYADESVAKNLAPAPLVRLYYSSLTGTEVCVSNIVDVVNEEYHNTLTAIGACQSVNAGDFADFVGGPTTLCAGESVTFNDASSGAITTYDWTFTGGSPASSTDMNPVVTYNTPGVYDVTLTVGNGSEIDSETKVGFITVNQGQTYYLDFDEDGYGDDANTTESCTGAPAGYTDIAGDCNDNDSEINPGSSELCDGLDQNCNDQVDEGLTLITYYLDSDNDGFGDDGNTTDVCDSTAPSGYVSQGGDCDDSDADVYPGAAGTFEGIDNNCDGEVLGDEEYVCQGDFNDDGIVNVSDLTGLLADFGCLSNCPTDLSGDDQVTSTDVAMFLLMFGTVCE